MKQATNSTQLTWRDHVNLRLREAGFILLSSIAIYILISLVTYHSNDPGWSYFGMKGEVLNKAGKTGALFSDILFSLFGYVAYGFPVAIFFIASFVYKGGDQNKTGNPAMWVMRIIGLLMALFSCCGLMSMHVKAVWQSLPMSPGGVLGAILGQGMVGHLNITGASVLLGALFLTGITLFTGLSWLQMADIIGKWTMMGAVKFKSQVEQWYEKAITYIKSTRLPSKTQQPEAKPTQAPILQTDKSAEQKKHSMLDILKPLNESDEGWVSDDADLPKFTNTKKPARKATDIFKRKRKEAAKKITPKKQNKNQPKSAEGDEYAFPSLSLLEEQGEAHDTGFSSSQLEQLSSLVETRLKEFGVVVKVVNVLPGPVITRFELDLAAGIKASKISGLAKDLARSMSIVSVRVVEIIPGKSLVGLEIPNIERETVRLKEILADESYQASESPLTMGLGKDISGRPVLADLARMPHLLVAGTTGSGKSVGLNAMLLSILYKATPAEVRLLLIDPKMLELAVYDNIPHLLTPVITDVKDSANALRWCVAEMEQRYQLMAQLGVRNIAGYNAKVKKAIADKKPILDPLWNPRKSEKPEPLEPFPYIVVLIDEFADMMMVVGKKVEELIARLAQKARAAGIHLILATQRPSVDVITGLIKANIPTRIGFQVSSRIDSRTILDQAGAEQLLGHGDMLFLPPGTGISQRIHGAFVSDEEVNKITDELRRTAKPDYIETLIQPKSSISDFGGDEEEYDELYDQAVGIVTETRRASISLVQRKLKIGYNRAARLLEQMENDGVVSQMQSNGSREVLAAPPPVE
tara:strand:+ start:19333 stop:21759 length:2427 start_codon:yes stop_codon:yes gene_type:complete